MKFIIDLYYIVRDNVKKTTMWISSLNYFSIGENSLYLRKRIAKIESR